MATIDTHINEMRRTGARKMILLSDSEPRVVRDGEELPFGGPLGHKQLTALIEEIVPAAKFADLVMMEPVRFELEHKAGVLDIRVVPGPSIWRVTVETHGDALAPLEASEEAGQADEAPADVDTDEATGESESSESWSAVEREVGAEEDAPEDAPKAGEDAPKAGEALGEAAARDPESGEYGFVLKPTAGETEQGGGKTEQGGGETEQGGDDDQAEGTSRGGGVMRDEASGAGVNENDPVGFSLPDRPTSSIATLGIHAQSSDEDVAGDAGEEPGSRRHDSLHGALMRTPRDSGEFNIEVADSSEGRDDDDDLSARQTVQLSALEVNSVTAGEGEDAAATRGGIGSPRSAVAAPEATGLATAGPETPARSAPARGSGPHVAPLEIEFREEDVPTIPIERLDELLDRAWRTGGTTLLLRDGRAPALGTAGSVEPLPGGRQEDGRLIHEILETAANHSHHQQLDIEGFCRFVYRPGGSRTLVRVTLVRDAGSLTAWIRRIGDEHFPALAARWLPVSVRNLVPEAGLVLVAGGAGQGKSTTAAALAAMCHEALAQTLIVADPLERRLPDEGVGILQRQIPEDAPNAARALRDARRLETRLVLLDVPRPEAVTVEMLALAGEGRLVIATWTAPSCVSAVEALMDALPPDLSPTERARRARNLSSVVTVRLVPAKAGGVLPIFETLRINQVVLSAVTEARLGQQAGAGRQDLVSLSFDASLAALESRGLI